MNMMRNLFGGGGNVQQPSGPFGNIMNMMSRFKDFMQNPIGAMMNSGVNIPPNIQNNPEAITNYLRSSGQMTDAQFNQVSQMANMAQGLFGKRS